MDLDANGNLFFADDANHRVRKIDNTAQHVISTVTGNRYEFYGGDGGIAKAGQFNEIIGVGVGAGINGI
jgi:hypothetical protein